MLPDSAKFLGSDNMYQARANGLVSLIIGIVRLLLNNIIRVIKLSLIFLIIVRNDLFRRFCLAALVYLKVVS